RSAGTHRRRSACNDRLPVSVMSRIVWGVQFDVLGPIGFEDFSRRQDEEIEVERVDAGVWNCRFRNEVSAVEFKEVCRWTGVRAAGGLWPSGNSDQDVSVRNQRSRSILGCHPAAIGSFWKSRTDRPCSDVAIID